jgi:hypothetical protein
MYPNLIGHDRSLDGIHFKFLDGKINNYNLLFQFLISFNHTVGIIRLWPLQGPSSLPWWILVP